MKKYDLFFGYFGNGCRVSNRAAMEHGDYKKVCHISDDGKITVYDHSAPADVMERIRAYAEQMKKEYTEKQEADRIAKEKHAEWLKNRMNGTAEPEEQTGTEEPKEMEKYIAVTESAGKIKIFDKFIDESEEKAIQNFIDEVKGWNVKILAIYKESDVVEHCSL